MADVDRYAPISKIIGAVPKWIKDPFHAARVASYLMYDKMFWNEPGLYKPIARAGAEDSPIYIPTPRVIVETIHRYLANQVEIIIDPAYVPVDESGNVGTIDPKAVELGRQVMTDFARRERFYSKFNTNKRFGVIRGDWCFFLYADPLRQPGTRISIFALDAGKYFPIHKPDNVDEIIGCDIAEPVVDSQGKERIRRTRYMKATGMGGPSPITVEIGLFEFDNWGGPGMNSDDAVQTEAIMPLNTLPNPIDHLPVYHIPNFGEPNQLWGSSNLRGFENVFAKINSAISDEDIALALEALGQYWTTAGKPTDDTGTEVPWNLGPGRVVEIPESDKFGRINGISSVVPYQEHLKYLHDRVDEASGISSIAKGKVDVNVAESGVALAIELGPLISIITEKEQIVTDVTSNMLYDLAKWFVAYEGSLFQPLVDSTRWIPKYGEKIPPNRDKQVEELLNIAGITPTLLPPSYVRSKLRKLGYSDLPEEAVIAAELASAQQSAVDLTGARLDSEVAAEGGGEDAA